MIKIIIRFIFIFFIDHHYFVVKSIRALSNNSRYFCAPCNKTYTNINNHYCKFTCNGCNRSNCENIIDSKCSFCNIEIRNETCKKYHEEQLCRSINKCKKCNNFVRKNSVHVCFDQKYCSNCKQAVDIDHKCYILTESERKESFNNQTTQGYIWFDYEAYQCEIDNIQKPNLIIAVDKCIKCINNLQCKTIGCGEHCFYDNDSFCQWLYNEKHKNYIAFAHNAKGYDGVYLLKWIYNNLSFKENMPQVIRDGTKILTLTYRNVKLLDSASFIPMSLEKFTKTFDLKELKKGFFCHLFNKPENMDYVGSIPSKKYFEPQLFNDEKLKKFDEWYASQIDKVYVFKQELYEYCRSDVRLLMEGTLAFRKIILDVTGIEPYDKAITLAGLCHIIYRTNMMKPKSIGIIPINGFNSKKQTSHKAIQWLKFISYSKNITIQHGKNIGELQIKSENDKIYHVDGYDKESETIYEFHGFVFLLFFDLEYNFDYFLCFF